MKIKSVFLQRKKQCGMEKANNNPKQKITFKYIFEDDYNPVYINGAFGGINPQGEIVANFYLERIALPNSTTHNIGADGIISEAIKKDPEDLDDSCVRFVQSGIVLNLDTAKQIRDWLDRNIKNLEKLKNK